MDGNTTDQPGKRKIAVEIVVGAVIIAVCVAAVMVPKAYFGMVERRERLRQEEALRQLEVKLRGEISADMRNKVAIHLFFLLRSNWEGAPDLLRRLDVDRDDLCWFPDPGRILIATSERVHLLGGRDDGSTYSKMITCPCILLMCREPEARKSFQHAGVHILRMDSDDDHVVMRFKLDAVLAAKAGVAPGQTWEARVPAIELIRLVTKETGVTAIEGDGSSEASRDAALRMYVKPWLKRAKLCPAKPRSVSKPN